MDPTISESVTAKTTEQYLKTYPLGYQEEKMRYVVTILTILLFVTILAFVAQASDEVTETRVVPLTVQDLNYQYGDSLFSWHRIHTDRFQFETDNDSNIRLGVRGELGTIGSIGVHARFLVGLSDTNLTEVRPEIMLYDGGWYTYISTGVDTRTGEASLYDETVFDFMSNRSLRGGLALVHNGGLSGQASTVNLGPHFGVKLSDQLDLDLHYGWALTGDTSNEGWAILSWKIQ